MSDQVPNVRTWSKTVPAYRFALADLDVYVLKEHREIVAAMDRTRKRGTANRADFAVVVLNVIAPIGGWIAWVGGIARSGMESDGLDNPEPLSAVAFTLAVVGLVIIASRWWRGRRQWSWFDVAGLVVSGILAGLTLATMANQPAAELLDLGPASIPVWITVAGAVLLGLLHAVASKGKRVEFGNHFPATGTADFGRVRELVGEVEPARQKKLLDERRRAIDRLRDRGMVDERQVAELQDLPLGLSPTLTGEVPG